MSALSIVGDVHVNPKGDPGIFTALQAMFATVGMADLANRSALDAPGLAAWLEAMAVAAGQALGAIGFVRLDRAPTQLVIGDSQGLRRVHTQWLQDPVSGAQLAVGAEVEAWCSRNRLGEFVARLTLGTLCRAVSRDETDEQPLVSLDAVQVPRMPKEDQVIDVKLVDRVMRHFQSTLCLEESGELAVLDLAAVSRYQRVAERALRP